MMQSANKTLEEKINNEKEESDMEELERESDDSDQSGSASGGDSSDGSESDEASELDEEYVRRRQNCLQEMFDLEKQYIELSEILIKEKLSQNALKLSEIKCGEAIEYLRPLAELEENMRIREEVAGILRQYRLKNLENEFEAEELTAKQNFENEKCLLYDSIEDELIDRIKHLEEDRNNVDINADLWMVERGLLKSGKPVKDKKHLNQVKGGSHRNLEPNSRRKPVTVSGPYIVYMLKDSEILEDWTLIKKALSNSNRKSSSLLACI